MCSFKAELHILYGFSIYLEEHHDPGVPVYGNAVVVALWPWSDDHTSLHSVGNLALGDRRYLLLHLFKLWRPLGLPGSF